MLIDEIRNEVIQGGNQRVSLLVRSALEQGYSVRDILENALIGGMTEIGEMFIRKEIYLPEMLFASRAMQDGMNVIEPLLTSAYVVAGARILLGTVKDDVHDIGKNLVAMMFKGAGFDVVDLGVDVSPEKFVAGIRAHNPVLVGMSSLLGTTMHHMRDTVRAIREERGKSVIIMAGGAIITQDFAEKIGADGYAPDAASAVQKARELLQLA